MSGLSFDANCLIEEHDAVTGELLSREMVHNKIPDIGINAILGLISGNGQLPVSYFAVGTGTTTPAAADVALGTERFRALTTQKFITGASLVVKFYLDTNSANGYTLTEAGLFDLAAGGDLFAHVIYTGKAKTSSNTISFSWSINAVSI